MATNTKTRLLQDLRRGNAAQPIPSKRVRRERTRSARDRAAIMRSKRGE